MSIQTSAIFSWTYPGVSQLSEGEGVDICRPHVIIHRVEDELLILRWATEKNTTVPLLLAVVDMSLSLANRKSGTSMFLCLSAMNKKCVKTGRRAQRAPQPMHHLFVRRS